MKLSKLMQSTPTTEKSKALFGSRVDNSQKKFHTEKLQFDDVNFILCGIFCAIAIVTLLIFSIAALTRGDISFAFTLFGFALATTAGIGAIWFTGEDWLAKHFTTLMMAVLCVYLFYTGGSSGTGPIIFLIFPPVALFLQGNFMGAYSVLALLIISSFIYAFNLFGFDNSLYTDAFINRVLLVFIITSSLSYAFSYFKDKAERELLENQDILEKNAITDQVSGLASHILLEKLLFIELNRVSRYFRPSSLILINFKITNTEKYKFVGINRRQVISNIVKIFNKVLRVSDTAGRMDSDSYLIILPETKIDDAQKICSKLNAVFNNYQKLFDDPTIVLEANIHCKEIFPADAEQGWNIIKNMENKLATS
jgi:diguanylate cyclase (GGDEF)-like protein